MTLRVKALVLVMVWVATLMGCVEILFSRVFLEQMARLEREQVMAHAIRVQEAIRSRVESVPLRLMDWAAWDDTYEFMETRNPEYIESNLVTTGIVGLEINFIIYFDLQKQPIVQKAIDFRAGNEIDLPPSILAAFSSDSGYLEEFTPNESRSGVLVLDGKILIFGIRPIIRSDKAGPPRGSLLWARYLDEQEIESIADELHVALRVSPVTPAVEAIYSKWKSEGVELPFARASSADEIHGYASILDYHGRPAIHIDVSGQREIYRRGLDADGLVLSGLLTAGIIFALVVAVSIERVVIRRISRVAKSLRQIARKDDFEGRLTVEGGDEIASLAEEINETLEALAQGRHGMRVAKELAEAASANKSNFVSTMSHEIRTPLNGILGMTEALQREHLSDAQREKVLVLNDCAESLIAIVNDVLDFAKIESGKIDVECINFDIGLLIRRVVNTVSERANSKGISLEVDFDSKVPRCLAGDPTRIGQVLINLLSNAVKFTKQGSVTLRMSGEARSDGDMTVHFSVKDTGIGMTSLQRTRIFEAFRQADASIVRRFGGTGLGLSISKKIVEIMGSKLVVESTEGVGSTFSFALTLPVGTLPETESKTIDDHLPVPTLDVFVVDDKESNRKVASLHLQSLGHRCRTFESGEELLAALEAGSDEASAVVDVIFLDIQMPVLSGPDIARMLRESQFFGRAPIPIIALTAQAISDFGLDEENSRLFDGWLPKPLRMAELSRELSLHSLGRGSRRPPHADAPSSPSWPAIEQIDSEFLWEQYLDRETIIEMLDCFAEECCGLCAELDEHLRQVSSPGISLSLHALRGALMNGGATDLAARAKDLDLEGRASPGEAAPDFLVRVEILCSDVVRLRDAIVAWLEQVDVETDDEGPPAHVS